MRQEKQEHDLTSQLLEACRAMTGGRQVGIDVRSEVLSGKGGDLPARFQARVCVVEPDGVFVMFRSEGDTLLECIEAMWSIAFERSKKLTEILNIR